MIGREISHYRILEELGRGGMGVVYRAEDLTLTRPVALKFLPQGLETHEPERARFLQEARAAAILNHPNICTIHEIGDAEGQQYIVMELVDGMTLRKKISEGKLPTSVAVEYAIQIGEALEEAHSKGIIHRDVKPDNIMVNAKNQVKVMDFGLAKLKGSLKLTKTTSTVGTLAYMAPEQIQGGLVDARSDIFSFGVILYEMLTGHSPFRAEHDAAMMYSIVNEEPESLQTCLPDAPSELLHTVSRALEKNPEERYQSIHDMLIDLRRLRKDSSRVVRPSPQLEQSQVVPRAAIGKKPWLFQHVRWFAAGAIVVLAGVIGWLVFRPMGGQRLTLGGGNEKSIAVMYFENRTDEKDIDKILVDMLITNLGRNKQISVVSGQRLFDILKSLGKQDAAVVDRSTATEAAKLAGVRTMLLGSIWNVGGKLNVTGQLLEVESGEVINSDRLEASKADEVFAIADRLTERVGEWLKESPEAALNIADASTGSYDAYRLYEQGIRHSYRFEQAEARQCFMQAIQLDSTFAMAHYRLARNLGWGVLMSSLPSNNLSLARDAIANAERYGGNLSDRERGMIDGYATVLRRDYGPAQKKWKALLARFPEDKEVLFFCAVANGINREHRESIRNFEKAIEVDRSFSDAYNMLGYAYCTIGDYDKAIATIRTYMALIPDAENGYDSGCEVLMMAGRFDDAMKIAEEGLRRVPTWYYSYDRQAQILLLKGEPDKAREKFALCAKFDPESREAMDRRISLSFAREGRMREATTLLEHMVGQARNAGNALNEMMARFYLARLLQDANRIADALKELETVTVLSRIIRTDPSNPWPLICDYYAGLCLAETGDYRRAEAKAEAMRSMIETTLRDTHFLIFYNGLQAEILLRREKPREAAASLDRIAPFARTNFPHLRMLDATIATQLGDRTRALELYEGARNLTQISNAATMGDFLGFWMEQSKLDYYLAKAHEHFGDTAGAISFYQKALHNWRKADKDYPPLFDASAGLARLVKQ